MASKKKPVSGSSSASLDPSWEEYTLANGMNAVHCPLPGDSRAYAGLIIRTGSRFENPTQLGVSHFLEHMMFRGSKKHPSFRQLAEAFEWLGGEWNAATGTEQTEYWYSGNISNLEEAVVALAEFMENPALLDMEIERQVILRELQGELNEFGHSTDISYQCAAHMWKDSTLAAPILGTEETLKSLTMEQLKAYRDKTYIPSNMSLCTVGGEKSASKRIKSLVTKSFENHRSEFIGKSIKKPAKVTPFVGPVAALINNTDNEYQVQLSFECEGQWSDKTALYEILVRILGDGFSSQLSCRLREELALVYEVNADTTLYTDLGTINVSAAVGLDNFKVFMTELLLILRKLADKGPTAHEVERAIRRTIFDLELLKHEPGSLGFRLAWMTGSGKDPSLDRIRDRIKAVTAAGIMELCRKLFRKKNACLIAIGPENKAISNIMNSVIEQHLL